MNRHMMILEHGETVMSSSMFLRTELYSEKHQARDTTEAPMEMICAVSIAFRAKSIFTVPSSVMETYVYATDIFTYKN